MEKRQKNIRKNVDPYVRNENKKHVYTKIYMSDESNNIKAKKKRGLKGEKVRIIEKKKYKHIPAIRRQLRKKKANKKCRKNVEKGAKRTNMEISAGGG